MSPSTSSGQSKLVVIDGYAILHRAFHALPPLTTRAGEPINAVYGLVSMLLKVITDLKPTHIAVAFDVKAPTFRHKEFKAYQAKRPEMAGELSGQIEKARRVIEAFGIPIYQLVGYEADDVIGTLAKKATQLSVLGYRLSDKSQSVVGLSETEKQKTGKQKSENRQQKTDIREVVIVTGDRDILQLVNDKVRVYVPVKGLSDAKLMGKKEVVEKMGVAPELIADYKALVGDPSDNYPGVPGIGPKGAVGLLKEFGTVENIYEWLDEVSDGKVETLRAQRGLRVLKERGISEQIAEKLIAGKKSAEVSHRLATIVTDVPIEFNFEKMAKWNFSNQKVLGLFAEFGFRTLTERVKKVGKELEEEKQLKLI
jgi:DNA polymerase-1